MKTGFIDHFWMEWLHLKRDYAFWGLTVLLFILMSFAILNSNHYQASKKLEVEKQIEIVNKFDDGLVAQIDSLNLGLNSYEESYTLPTSGVRLTYNNHRIAVSIRKSRTYR